MIDKIEKKMILLTCILLITFVVALVYAAQDDVNVPLCVPYDGTYLESRVKEISPKTFEVVYVAGMWQFQPDVVEVPKGAEVDIYLSTKDVVHGFHIKDKGLNLMAVPGAIVKQTVKFDNKGIYKIVCHEYCGVGHQNMEGQIIVK